MTSSTRRFVPGRAYTGFQKMCVMWRLLNAWMDYPELRLGQFLFAIGMDNPDRLFNVEDRDLAEIAEYARQRGLGQ